jgi:arabinogalactan endo-1,4-beta-galactosidase
MNLQKQIYHRVLVCAALLLGAGSLAPHIMALEKGVDVSWMPQMEASGVIWKNKNGTQEDLLKICKELGVTTVRLRTWVNPSNDKSNGHCSQAETIALAQRAKAAGMNVYIDFHYGDTWNSVGHQNPPAAWAGMSYTNMKVALHDYTFNFLTALKNAGVTPNFCSPGNEINSGICHPTGSISNPAQMTGLIMEGQKAIKAVFPNCKVVIHVAQLQNSGAINMLDAYKANGGQWDVSGFSSYAHGGNVAGIISNMDTLASRYGKPVMQVEFGGAEANASSNKTDFQKFFDGMKALGSNGLGCFYWEPECYASWNGYGSGSWDPSTLRPTVALDPLGTN